MIKLSILQTLNLPPPMSTNCGSRSLRYFDEYHQKACFLEKITDRVGKKCGCRQQHMPGKSKNIQYERICCITFMKYMSEFNYSS